MLDFTGELIMRLGDEDLRTLVVKLCEAELRRAGQPSSALLAGGNQTAKDGGIDVRVQLAKSGGSLDFILRAATGFQVKCEDMPASGITKEMRPGGNLRESIKDLIANKGAYVIVSSKGTVADTFLRQRLRAMREAVADQPDASGLTVDFYDRDRLARWVRQYRGVEMWVREVVNARLQGWQGNAAWAGGKQGDPYIHDDTDRLTERRVGGAANVLSVPAGVDRLRATLKKPGQVIRIIGLSGTGKTRLVQALFEPGVGNIKPLDEALALYTDLGHSPDPTARDMLLHLGAIEQRAIVIVDNCNPTTHRTLTEVVRQYPNQLSLVTVEYDVADDDLPEATDVFVLAPSSPQVLEGILARLAPHLTAPDRHRITEFAGGNARIALALAQTVEKGESLGVLNDAELFRRLFRQGRADDDELLRAAEVCSLVYSFEGEDTKSDESELRVLAGLAGTSARELYRRMETLKRRDLVQSRSKWRALLPPALANRLAKSALQNIPRSDILDAFSSSERLLVSFSRRLEYLHDSEEARSIANRWIEDENWLANPATLNAFGRKLFVNLAPLLPDKALASIERALSVDNIADFTNHQKGALHDWAALLRHLSYESQAFDRAALLMLTLAEAEDEQVDCLREWKEMFRIGLSGTMAPPEQRALLLKRLLTTESGKRKKLAWDAVEAMLEAHHISSSHDFSFGARPQGFGWEPLSSGDLKGWFESAIGLLRQMSASGHVGRERARHAVAAHFRELWGCGVHNQVTALVRDLTEETGWPDGWVAARGALRFDCANMPPEVLSKLRGLEKALAPKGTAQEIRTYTLGRIGGLLDVAEAVDESDEAEDKNPLGAWERVNEKVIALGAAAAADDATLREVLPALLSDQNGRQHSFGYGLGQATPDGQRHWKLLYDMFMAAPQTSNVQLLAGFVQGVRSKDSAAATHLLEGLAEDTGLAPYFPLIHGVPHNDADGDRLIDAMQRGLAKPHTFRIRGQRTDTKGLSLTKFCQALDALSRMEGGLVSALDELGAELYQLKAENTAAPAEMVQLARGLLATFDFDARGHNVVWRVNDIAKVAFAGPEGEAPAVEFARRLAAALDEYKAHGDEYGDLACTIFRLQPMAALDAFLSKPAKKRYFGFRSRFVSRNGPVLQCAPEEVIFSWVRAAPETRAALVAAEIGIISTKNGEGPELNSLASFLLDATSDKALVLAAFSKNFHPTHWSGSLAQTLAPFTKLLDGLSAHPDPAVAAWATDNLSTMTRRIERDSTTEMMTEGSFE